MSDREQTAAEPAARGVRFFGILAAIFFAVIFALVFFTSGAMEYACRFTFTANRQLLFSALGAVVFFAACFACRIAVFYVRPHVSNPERAWRILVAATCIALLCYQALVVSGAWFKTDWDARALAAVDDPESIRIYLSRYPNQLFLYGLFQGICALGRALGSPDTYLTQIVGSCLCVTFSVFFAAHASRSIGGLRVGIVALAVMCVLVGASPWMLVPYSDTYGMMCPSVALWLYAAHRDRPTAWLGIAFASVVGYAIKPTSIFILCAVLFVEGIRLAGRVLARRRSRRAVRSEQAETAENREVEKPAGGRGARRAVWFAAAVVVGALAASLITGAVDSSERSSIGIDSDLSFSMSHYLMMGINTDTMGIYNNDDVHRSSDCNSQAERSAMNIKVWKERMAKLGPAGLAHLYHQKLLTAFSDGTFAWGVEGEFWIEMHGDNAAIKSYYGIGNFNRVDPNAQNGMWFQVVTQTLWLASLMGIVALGFSRKLDAKTVAPMLAVSALALFLMVFETRSRYLFLYAPYFCILGTLGWTTLTDRASAWLASLANETPTKARPSQQDPI